VQSVREFAEKYQVRVKRDGVGDYIVRGRNQSGDRFLSARIKTGKSPERVENYSHIFEGYENGLGLCLMYETKRKWTSVKRHLESAGFTLRQDGDTEGTLTFDATDAKQSRLAIKMAGIRTRRHATAPSPAQIAVRQKFAANQKNGQ
jgi:hypothetical protein